MLYMGHFSFDFGTPTAPESPAHGLFTCVAEAANIDAAIAKFNRLIRDLVKRHDVFDGVAEIYLDACVELRSVPRSGVMSYITIREGEDIGGISATLLGNRTRDAVSYAWGPARKPGSLQPQPMKPFIRLRRRAKVAPVETVPEVATAPVKSRKESVH